MGAFVEAGCCCPLDGYADVYGWDEPLPRRGARSARRYTADGKTFGEGSLYGLPQTGEFVGVYYNKAELDELGIEPPQTWEDFEAALADRQGGRRAPVQFGNLDKWPGIHVFGVRAEPVRRRRRRSRDLGFGREGAAWTTPGERRRPPQTLPSWVEARLLHRGLQRPRLRPGVAGLRRRRGVFLIAGTWLLADLEAAMGDDRAASCCRPPARAAPLVGTGGTGLPFAITSASEHPDAAAAYLDFITNADAMAVITEAGNLPASTPRSRPRTPGSGRTCSTRWATVDRATDGLVPYLDYATPTFYDTLAAALQDLIDGQQHAGGVPRHAARTTTPPSSSS